jgi:hypothetical protein
MTDVTSPYGRFGVFVDFIDLTIPQCAAAASIKPSVTIKCVAPGAGIELRTTTNTGLSCDTTSSPTSVTCTGVGVIGGGVIVVDCPVLMGMDLGIDVNIEMAGNPTFTCSGVDTLGLELGLAAFTRAGSLTFDDVQCMPVSTDLEATVPAVDPPFVLPVGTKIPYCGRLCSGACTEADIAPFRGSILSDDIFDTPVSIDFSSITMRRRIGVPPMIIKVIDMMDVSQAPSAAPSCAPNEKFEEESDPQGTYYRGGYEPDSEPASYGNGKGKGKGSKSGGGHYSGTGCEEDGGYGNGKGKGKGGGKKKSSKRLGGDSYTNYRASRTGATTAGYDYRQRRLREEEQQQPQLQDGAKP